MKPTKPQNETDDSKIERINKILSYKTLSIQDFPFTPFTEPERFYLLNHYLNSIIDNRFFDFVVKFSEDIGLYAPDKVTEWVENKLKGITNSIESANGFFTGIKIIIQNDLRAREAEIQSILDAQIENDEYQIEPILQKPIIPPEFINRFLDIGFRNEYLNPELEIYKDSCSPIDNLNLPLYQELINLGLHYRIWLYLQYQLMTLKEAPTKKAPKQQLMTSYVWQGKPEDLTELYSLMIYKYKLIASETTYEQFNAVFTGQPIDSSFEPIRWHKDNATELLYFIEKLEQSNNIKHNPKRADYQKLAACFVNPDGKNFTAAWKSLKTNIDISLSPDKQKAINEMISNF